METLDGNNIPRVVIIDSGVCRRDDFNHNIIGGGYISPENGGCFIEGEFHDSIGHGTAVVDIILRKCTNAYVYIIKVFDDQLVTTIERLCSALEVILQMTTRVCQDFCAFPLE